MFKLWTVSCKNAKMQQCNNFYKKTLKPFRIFFVEVGHWDVEVVEERVSAAFPVLASIMISTFGKLLISVFSTLCKFFQIQKLNLSFPGFWELFSIFFFLAQFLAKFLQLVCLVKVFKVLIRNETIKRDRKCHSMCLFS